MDRACLPFDEACSLQDVARGQPDHGTHENHQMKRYVDVGTAAAHYIGSYAGRNQRMRQRGVGDPACRLPVQAN